VLSLIPAFPLVGFIINAFLGSRLSKAISGGLACLALLASFAVSVMVVRQLVSMPEGAREITEVVFNWFSSGSFSIDLAFRLDPLAAVMILVVTGIGSLIHIYSTAYMHEETDSEYARYFSYLNLFVFFMLVLVLGANVVVMFVGWEGVGLCSYLLIGYSYQRKSAADAAKKAFVVNRIGDYAFVLGTLLMAVTVGTVGNTMTLDFKQIAANVSAMDPELTFGTLSIITLLLFIGATGKSAQIPLYVWLPDAMEGPTPVSALIHAATMVTAGVYMIGRNAVLFEHAPLTLNIVAVIGTATAIFAGTIGLVQNDIKRVLAYSTVSQLGYMFLAMGVGAFGAGIFHLYTHAFFKALLFLGSGAVIHALHGEQDLRNMGGLKKYLPITYWTFVIGALAIAGIPPLAGFFSKDEILFETFARGYQWLWVVGIITSFLTATYMWRLVHLTFHGPFRFSPAPVDASVHAVQSTVHGHGGAETAAPGHAPAPTHHGVHLHEAPPAMAIALVVLALGSVAAGFVGVPHALGGSNEFGRFLEPAFEASTTSLASLTIGDCAPATTAMPPEPGSLASLTLGDCAPGNDVARVSQQSSATGAVQTGREPPEHTEAAPDDHEKITLERTLMGVSVLVALLGIGLATWIWLKRPEVADRVAARVPGLYRLLLNKYYVDEAYDATVVQPIKIVSEEALWRGMDARVVDGAVNGAGQVVGGISAVLRLLQNGSVKTYAASTFLGVVVILAYYVWR
jgi:NADH-quinone oxidoreductase subunit L